MVKIMKLQPKTVSFTDYSDKTMSFEHITHVFYTTKKGDHNEIVFSSEYPFKNKLADLLAFSIAFTLISETGECFSFKTDCVSKFMVTEK